MRKSFGLDWVLVGVPYPRIRKETRWASWKDLCTVATWK